MNVLDYVNYWIAVLLLITGMYIVIARGNLVKKLITAEQIAWLVAFLASPKAMAINGDSIPAGGGTPGAIYY